MIVVADTSPLNYLIQIDCADVLPVLYKRVLIPLAVLDELKSPKAPPAVRSWTDNIPDWIEVHRSTSSPSNELDFLDRGEREAIQLAGEYDESLLLIDERKGRIEATRRGLYTTGTLGVLLAAGRVGLVDPHRAYRRLVEETSFRTSTTLEAQFLSRFRQ